MDLKQYEDNVQQLETDNIHKDQQLQEVHSRLQDVQQQLDSAKVCSVTTAWVNM